MELIIFESDAYNKMLAEQANIFKRAIIEALKEIKNGNASSGDQWLTLKQAQELLPYKSKTKWQELRDKGEIEFSQFGRKILYKKESIMNYVKKNKV